MRISKKILLLCVVLCGAAVTAGAQSAYSKFGYGLLRDNVTAAQSLMLCLIHISEPTRHVRRGGVG
ncbi:MAG: hypothetical protein K2M94_01985, partial [Paramuribaculum sp.]|nr:hypothetical protein [Paramuribaculum sp.]